MSFTDLTPHAHTTGLITPTTTPTPDDEQSSDDENLLIDFPFSLESPKKFPTCLNTGCIPLTDTTFKDAFRSMIANPARPHTRHGHIHNWDVSRVTEMNGLFSLKDTTLFPLVPGSDTFNADITKWNTGSVKNMTRMFAGAEAFNQPIGEWDTSQVHSMEGMFLGAKAFNQPIASNTNDDSPEHDMDYMLYHATPSHHQQSPTAKRFTRPTQHTPSSHMSTPPGATTNDTTGWNTRRVNNMARMFAHATAFNQPIGEWNTEHVHRMDAMFQHAPSFNQPIDKWDTANVTTMQHMFSDATNFNQPIGNWVTTNVTTMERMFAYATNFNQPIGNWDTANVADMCDMFKHAAAFDQRIYDWDTHSRGTYCSMFQGATTMKHKNARPMEFRSFDNAHQFATTLSLTTQHEWAAFVQGKHTTKCPPDVPFHPDTTYPTEWRGWHHWLGDTYDTHNEEFIQWWKKYIAANNHIEKPTPHTTHTHHKKVVEVD